MPILKKVNHEIRQNDGFDEFLEKDFPLQALLKLVRAEGNKTS